MHFKGVKAKTISYFKTNQSKGEKILQKLKTYSIPNDDKRELKVIGKKIQYEICTWMKYLLNANKGSKAP